MSNAHPRPDADEPVWPDLPRPPRADQRTASPRDTGRPADGDRPLRAVPSAQEAWWAADGRPPADDGRTSWPDEPLPPADQYRRDPQAVRPPPEPRGRVVPAGQPPPRAGRVDAPQQHPDPRAAHVQEQAEERRPRAAHVEAPGHVPPDLPAPDDAPARRPPDEIEVTVPAGRRLREAVARLSATARASVPIRSMLFLLPPLVLPALAFDLSVAAALTVSVLLLWLAGAAGIMATMMFEGTDQLALRAIERRLDGLSATGRPTDDEALLAVGAQLDALNDRLDELTAAPSAGPAAGPADGHRPQEQWSSTAGGAHTDGYDHDVVSGRHWSQPRWQR